MNLTNEKINNFSVININGRIDSTNYAEFEKQINLLFNSGETNIIINCKGLKYISSSGLRIFLIAQKKAAVVKGKLRLCEMQPSIKEIFVISGFSTIFNIFETMEEALQ
jgi:anti-sigma B factor antagonist